MRRGQTACIFDSCSNMQDLLTWFVKFLEILQAKVDGEVDPEDPTLGLAKKAVTSNRKLCIEELEQVQGDAWLEIITHASLGCLFHAS